MHGQQTGGPHWTAGNDELKILTSFNKPQTDINPLTPEF
jgi:hypothetical protein